MPVRKIDLSSLPDEALLNAREVERLCALSRAALDRRLSEGAFPEPVRHHNGHNRLWPLGLIRAYLRALARGTNPRAAVALAREWLSDLEHV
jgi:predicted DNA-binding transcriptional regulator AlpA